MTPQDATMVTIDGSRTTLVFGLRYTLRYGSDDTVIRDAILDHREANGDLSFLVLPDATGANGGRRRVRPSTIDSLVGSGTEYLRRGDETAVAFLERAERELGRWYSSWIATEAGQIALELAGAEDRAVRRGTVRRGLSDILAGSATAESVLAELAPTHASIEAEAERNAIPPEVVAYAHDELDAELDPDVDSRAVGATVPGGPTRVAEILPAVVQAARAGRPYAERNQVWRCGSCKRRTRDSFCENGHPRVEAPAGKRRESRS